MIPGDLVFPTMLSGVRNFWSGVSIGGPIWRSQRRYPVDRIRGDYVWSCTEPALVLAVLPADGDEAGYSDIIMVLLGTGTPAWTWSFYLDSADVSGLEGEAPKKVDGGGG